jgi:hypothetical protein
VITDHFCIFREDYVYTNSWPKSLLSTTGRFDFLYFSASFLLNIIKKYGHVAFDSSQKAVLTSCVLRYRPSINLPRITSSSGATTNGAGSASVAGSIGEEKGPSIGAPEEDDEPEATHMEEGFVNCCFSFTIRRDKWGIPTMIVGNFIKC